MNRNALPLDRATWLPVVAVLLSGCLPKVDFTPCPETGRCVGRDVLEDGDARDAVIDDLADAAPVDALDASDVVDAGDASDAGDAGDDLADALDASGVEDVSDAGDAREEGADAVDVSDATLDAPVDVAPDAADVAPDVLRCDAGASVVDGACAVIAAPRPIAPLSTSTVTSQTPRLRWELRPGTDGARIELCRERACATVVHRFEASGATVITPMTLTPGVWFWRAAGMRAGDAGTSYGPTWQFVVGHGSAAVNTAWGNTPDFNGDGYADLAVAERQSVLVFYGSPTGLRTTPTVLGVSVSTGTLDFISALQCGGDLNGDGFPELLVTVSYLTDASRRVRATLVFAGSSTGLSPRPAVVFDALGVGASPAGDFNLDGYGDVTIDDALALGNSAGWPTDDPRARSTFGFPSGAAIGDANGDEYSDVALFTMSPGDGGVSLMSRTYLGNASGRVVAPLASLDGYANAIALGDLDGDGYADFASTRLGGVTASVFRGGALSPTMFTTLNSNVLSAARDIDADGDDEVIAVGDASTTLWLGARSSPLSVSRRVLGGSGGELTRALVQSLGSPGDIDRDGFADFAIASEGRLYIYSGAATTGPWAPSQTITGVLGTSIAR